MNFTGPAEDRLAIRELCDQYGAGALNKDMTMFGDTFAEDAERARLGTVTKGRSAIVAETKKNMENFQILAFSSNMGCIHVAGDRGTGRCYQTEVLLYADGPQWVASYYDDEYIKLARRWYFQKRTLTLLQKGRLPQSISEAVSATTV